MKKKFTDLFSKGTYKSDSNEKKSTKDVATVEKVGYFELYRFATFADKVLLVIGSILTIIVGIGNPLMMTFFGDVTQAFVTYDVEMRRLNATNGNDTAKMDGDGIDAGTVFYAELVRYVIISSIFGTLTVVLTYIATVIFHYTAQKQIFKIRTSYFRSVLNQDIAWYDTHQTGDFVTRITEDLIKIQEAIGDKVSIFLYFFSVFVAGIVIALTLGWQLALVCLVPCPLSIASMAFMTCITTKFTKNEMESYGAAGAIAEEVFGAIKTVTAFEGQAKEHERYKKHLVAAERNNMKRSIFTAIATGVMWFNIYAAIALSFWYGVKLVLESRHLPEEEAIYNTSVMFAVFFATLSSNWSFGQCSPYFDKFAAAQTAAYKIFRTIDAAPNINASKAGGQTPARIAGEIAFDDVRFEYPSRPDVKILKGLSFRIKAGETVALVGASGCGKSTCIQLIQRFYDPTSGCVSLDGTDVRKLNLNWLRSHIGVVGQEPVLFATTIAENIRYGNVKVTQAEIEEAAKKANAHSFIIGLPDGYQTLVGERGAQLSGGQKQRIAIARALVKTPTILLLDEATSALDTNSESIVQAALDSASKNSTTVIVAHRLSTVRDADRILVVADGAVVEEGTHTHLMDLKNHYYNLVMRQTNEIDVVNDEEDRSAADEEIADDAQRKLSRVDRKEHDVNEESPIDDSVWSALKSVMRMNRPEWFHIALGCLSSIATGAALPIYSVIFGSVIGVLSHTDDEYVRSRTDTYCLYLLVLGLLAGVASFVQMHTFTVAGEKLTKRIRSRLFCAVLRQEQGWFDAKENGVGGLCARLSTDAAYIQGASGQPIGTLLNAASTLGLAIGFAVSFEWRTALVTLCFTPVLLISVYLEQKILTASATKHNKPFEDSSKLAVEAINGIRTVASLGCEETFIDMYHDKLEEYVRKARNDGHFEGFALGMCRGSMFVTYGISLFYGGTLVLDQTVDYSNVFKATEALVTGSWSMGTAIGYAPNFQKGLLAAKKIMRIINRVPSIRNPSYVRELVWDNGTINYKRVTFAYPTRPTTTVLHGLDLHIEQGHTVALVGASGCGKSTIVQLLQRFYDPTSGRIALDATDIKDVTLQALRANFGIVSQEPVLFDRTIAENIAYGDNNRAVTMAEIIEAAKSANIHGFVIALPQGYDTPLGEKGTQLSGGQKQRMAIARALIRNPKVLLLDEATSALDAESEKIVQEALDNAKKDRTCITIAHRLTTIKDADVICVVNRGRIEEIGSHNELLQKKGLYYNLQMLQK